MTNLFASVNHNSQDVEEGQLPPDGHQQPALLNPNRDNSNLEHDSSSGQIVLEVVDDQFYSQRRSRKNDKKPPKSKSHTSHKERERDRDKEKGHHDRSEKEKDRKQQRGEKKANMSVEREEPNAADSSNKNPVFQPPYYPPYMYPPPPVHVQMGQYPPLYHPYSYSLPPYPHYPPPQNTLPPNQSQPTQYPQYHRPQYQEFPERPADSTYKMPPPPPPHMNMYGYPGYPMPYSPYDYYDRHREAQQREQHQRASRKKEYMDELRNELRRNVKDFNNDESIHILQAVKCILKFQDHRPPVSHSPSSNITEPPPQHHDIIRDSIAQRCYERSLLRVEKWLEGDNANIREFMKGLLEAMQMGDVILKIKELKLNRKMQEESLQSETKRLLDVLVRDPKKMIF